MAIQLNGTIANWQQHKSALESSLYELGVGHLLDMTDDQVPPTPDAITATNAAAVGFATRLLSDHRDKDMKGYGYMTKCMDPGTRQMVLDKWPPPPTPTGTVSSIPVGVLEAGQ